MVFKKILEVSVALESMTQAIPAQSAGAYILLFAAPFIGYLLADSKTEFI